MSVALKQFGNVVDEFLAELEAGAEARSRRLMKLLEEKGGAMRTDSKPLGDGLFELKIKHKKREYRLLYFFHDEAAVFVNCFEKKTRKTPKRELDNAKARMTAITKGTQTTNDTIH
ncbi:hypothetical protein HY29_02845 [Hyphomonas beringensis]|uniref:Toxin RelE n=1 Tax=Hyphomonas beringensis TaxID=1280946 RepID=A0A062U8F9_9PROT|nr:type II toxin-antitoxin system RelE/ParE family toxin [Hyphomonas beringensis]KCZ54023.1 hypothetical protein HY29_02845 [Hyphomonas beringensis]